MGRKLDLSGLTDCEAEHVLQVVQRDMKLRKKEEERLCELRQELDEEGSRCLLLSRQSRFNQRCCIRCCAPFTFLLNSKRQCRDCRYNVCKACRIYNKRDKAWLCSACQKNRLLKTQSLEWFYTNVRSRFKRFGSAKVLKTLYKKHLVEHGVLAELTEGSAYEESICNEGSVCGSDSTFYRQSEEHSMAETLTVALRVAEEAIDEAISKAESDTGNQEKQNEAYYLREHRRELIEELTQTIVQKIISRRKTLAEMKPEYDQDCPPDHNTDLHHHQLMLHSSFSLLGNDPPDLNSGVSQDQDPPQGLKKEGGGSAMSTYKSVDRLDNSSVSSMLKSSDGNWIALQSAQLSRPSLLTKRKSLVYSALERESGVVSAYEGMGSDNEAKAEPDSSWGAALQEFHRKMTDSNFNLHDTQDTHSHQTRTPSPLVLSRRGSRDVLFSDSEGNLKPLLALFKRKMPQEIRRPSSHRTSIIDVNFNPEGAGEDSSGADELEVGKVRRSWKKRRSKKEQDYECNVKKDNESQHASDVATPDTLTSGAATPEPFDLEGDIPGCGANQMDQELTIKLQQLASQVSICHPSTDEDEFDRGRDNNGEREEKRGGSDRDQEEDERLWKMEINVNGGGTEDEKEEEERTKEKEEDNEKMKHQLYRLVARSSITYLTSNEDELDRVGQCTGDREEEREEDIQKENEEKREARTEALTFKLCQLEKQVRANQFSSTEDELDRVGLSDGERERGEEEDGKKEELVAKLCRLARQVNATQFSSSEDELDRVGEGKEDDEGRAREREEVMDKETLWKMEAEKAVQAAQACDLASLVSVCQFSSTEDELDRVVENKGEREEIVNKGELEREDPWSMKMEFEGVVQKNEERRESIGDFDMKMFGDEVESEGVKLENAKKVEKDKSEESNEKIVRDTDRHRDETDTVMMKEMTEERIAIPLDETRVQQENILHHKPEVGRSDEKEGEGETREVRERKGEWETEEIEEEDVEFDRIISSMLMMSLEEMQVDAGDKVKDAFGEITGTNKELEEIETDENDKIEGETGFEEKMVDAQSRNESKETVLAEEFGRQGENMMPESVTGEGERPGESVIEPNKGELCRKQETGVATCKNGQQETKPDPPETTEQPNLEKAHMTINEIPQETGEAKWAHERMQVDEEEQKYTREKMLVDVQKMERQGDITGKKTDEKVKGTKGKNAEDVEGTPSDQEGILSPEEIQNRYSAVSLRSITTEVLKVLNATEELLQGVEGGDKSSPRPVAASLPPNTDPKKLDQQFSRLEENVYVAAGTVYSLETELSDLEDCARGISSATSDKELSFLEEQVASAAAKVQQSELQISDISARIAALKSAGLNVDPQSRFTKARTIPVTSITLDSSRQLRRRLPAPPMKDKEA